MIYNVIVVASNDNESSQVTLPRFLLCAPVPVIRGLTRFLIMAEVAKSARLSLTVWQFFMKRVKEVNIITRRMSLDVWFRELKNAL